jgi:NADH-quinone oxidoreductase subunit E
MLSDSAKNKIRELMATYPETRSALMPALYVAQGEYGWLPMEAIDEVAGLLGLTATEVGAVASFYDMYHVKPVGRHVVEFCTDLPCALLGAEAAFKRLCGRLGLEQTGGTTGDGAITLRAAPCLGACDRPVVVLVDNERQEQKLDDGKLDSLVETLRRPELA